MMLRLHRTAPAPALTFMFAFASAFALALALLCPAPLSAQVPVQINSGNPAFPFPQFLPYVHANGDTLYNLGTRNPAGVTHAEMEKAIRDAYQIMMNRADYATLNGVSRVGGTNGTRYIAFRSEPRCSEGDGYAMLAAAMMADKTTFDGLWLHVHDFSMNRVTRYGDGGRNSPSYPYSTDQGTLPGVYGGAGDDSAADGDYDIAMALMIAHLQWGDLMGINDSRGNPISYRNDFIKVLKGLTDTLSFNASNFSSIWSGSIGLDGFFKGGNTWADLTGWAGTPANLGSIGIHSGKRAEQPGPTGQYFDYNAPAYFRQFADYLKRQPNASSFGWNISQFERAEASSNWLMGQLIGQNTRNIPFAGWVDYQTGGTPQFGNISAAEDVRAPWRTVLNYVWHGHSENSWNPATHTVIRNMPDRSQQEAGRRFARFLWDRRQAPWNSTCETIIGEGLWWGPSMIKWSYDLNGSNPGTWPINWTHGSGSPSAVTSQDFDLMAEMYRQMEIEWDVATPGDRYLTSVPVYFHGFFRLLGMMVLTGNHHAPLEMKRGANMKVYLDVDKTYAFENDTVTYTVDYRNYGAEAAQGVIISNRLHNDMVLVSSTGGGSYDPSTNTVSWNIGSVPGYSSSMGANPAQTMGRVTYKVIIPYANLKRYESEVRITCTNGPGWVSNEFPNRISSIMKRNGVDIARRALRVDFSVFRDTVNPGMEATYTLNFENSAEAGWLNGGRPGVNFTYAHSGTQANDVQHTFMLRAFSDAHEAYIDYGNYRISYFMFDNNYRGIGGTTGWQAPLDIVYPPAASDRVALRHENITPGEDTRGKWNQRLILQISDTQTDTNWLTMAAPTQFLINYSGLDQRVHRGTSWPFKAVWRMHVNYVSRNWGADWSFNPQAVTDVATDAMANWGYPVSPDFSGSYDPDYAGVPVTAAHRKLCETPRRTVENVLIEEWDGYTWRRVAGNGPVPGREVTNVVIRDTLPAGVTFKEFVGTPPFGITPRINGRVITWSIDTLLVGQGGSIKFTVIADTPNTEGNRLIRNRAWISGDREAPTFGEARLVVTRDSLPPLPPSPTTMYKYADKDIYYKGDTVTYTIGYKQTHGYIAASTSRDQWTGTGTGNISGDGRTITFGGSSIGATFTPSLGTNVTLTGTIRPVRYENDFYINAAGRADVGFKWEWEGIIVSVRSGSSQIGQDVQDVIVNVPNPDNVVMDYKIVLSGDSLRLWVGDTSLFHPYAVFTGLPVREGLSGVRYTSPGYGGASITNWTVRSDRAYVETVRDTVPFGLTVIESSMTGLYHRYEQSNGNYYTASTSISASLNNGVITWDNISSYSGVSYGGIVMPPNDSVTLTWKAVADTARNGRIVNTAYADIVSYPRDSIGAQVQSRYSPEPPPPPGKLGLIADPPGGTFNGSVAVTLTSDPSGAVIYYTTNGTTPTPGGASTRQFAAGQTINITSTTTLTAVAIDAGGEYEQSDALVHVYEIIPLPGQLSVSADPPGGMFVGSVAVTLSASPSSVAGVRIWYTLNSTFPDSSSAAARLYVPGQPILISAPTTLRAVAYASGYERSEDIMHIYEFTRSVPVRSAIFFDNAGDGLAHGIKIVVTGQRDEENITKHIAGLIRFDGMPGVESVSAFNGDTVTVYFVNGVTVNPDAMPKLTIISPDFANPQYTLMNDGYLTSGIVDIVDGVAPIITGAVYYPTVGEDKPAPTAGDTLAVTFNKYARFQTASGSSVPFVFTRGGSAYELELEYVRRDNLTVYFVVRGLTTTAGAGIDIPVEGDMVRIKTGDDEVMNLNGYPQRNQNNTAVPLLLRYPDLEYIVKIGPVPFNAAKDSLRIAITLEPFLPSAFEALNPDIRIYDAMGNVAASTGRNLNVSRDAADRSYIVYWNGTNRMGRRAGTGTYLVHIAVKDQDGQTKTIRRKIYLRSR